MDKKSYDLIFELNNLRNKITHYEVDLNKDEVLHIVSNILKLMIPIFKENIKGFEGDIESEGMIMI